MRGKPWFDAELHTFKLNTILILMELYFNVATRAQLNERLRIDRHTLARRLDFLAKRGWIRSYDPLYAFKTFYGITPLGRQRLEREIQHLRGLVIAYETKRWRYK